MTGAGFYEQKSIRPGGLALVIAMHAAAFAALVLVKTVVEPNSTDRTAIEFVPLPPEPKQEIPPERQQVEPRQPTVLDTVDPVIDLPQLPGLTTEDPPLPPLPPIGQQGERTEYAGIPDLPPPPVRVEAQLDPRYAADLQPPYPPSELSSERDGTVRIRVTVGADGRVKAVQRLSATSDAFWRATERHALARWRFRPATLDGRPVESTKVMNVHFRMEG